MLIAYLSTDNTNSKEKMKDIGLVCNSMNSKIFYTAFILP
jgi:hypothetical protein